MLAAGKRRADRAIHAPRRKFVGTLCQRIDRTLDRLRIVELTVSDQIRQ
jgi:hypothetical protein